MLWRIGGLNRFILTIQFSQNIVKYIVFKGFKLY